MRRTAVAAALLISALAATTPTPAGAAPTSSLGTWAEVHLPLPHTAVAVDLTRGRLLVGVDPSVPTLGNHLVEVDTVTGEVGRELFVGVAPRSIAVSQDGTRAYVGYSTPKPVVTEIDLATFTVVREFGVGEGLGASSIFVQPGRADVIAVNRGRSVAIFDDGAMRPDTFTGVVFGGIFGFRNAGEVVGTDGILDSVWRGAVDAQGVHQISRSSSGTVTYGFPDIDETVLTFPNGRVYDIDTGVLLAPEYDRASTVMVDHDHDVAYFFSSRVVTRASQASRTPLDTRAVNLTGSARILDTGVGLALADGNQIVLLGPAVTGAAFALPDGPPSIVRDDVQPTVADVAATAMVADPDGRHLWVTTSAADSQPGSLVELDARTGERTRHLTLAGGPSNLAVTNDGSTIVVGYATRNVVTEIATDDLTTVREVTLPDLHANSSRSTAITPVPDTTDHYLVVLASVATSERTRVLVAGGSVRPDQVGGGGLPFFLDDPTLAYSIEDNTGFALQTIQVGDNGLTYLTGRGSIATDFVRHVSTYDGLAYASTGDVFDPVARERRGRMGTGQWEVLVPEQDRVLYVHDLALTEYQLSEQSLVATHDPALDADDPVGAVRVGDRVAVLTRTPTTITFVAIDGPPRAVRRLHAAPQAGAIDVTWRAPADDGGSPVTAYRIERDGQPLAEVDGSTRHLLDEGLTDGEAHAYRVTAVNALGDGDPSDIVSRASGGADLQDPTVTVTAPVDGVHVHRHATLVAHFSCADEVGGSGLATCTGDLDGGAVADGQSLDTDALGPHELTVSAEDGAGNLAEVTRTYTVDDVTRPTIAVRRPTPNQAVIWGSTALADFTCRDESGGSGLVSCTGTVADGEPLNTARLGRRTFRVTATDAAGNTTVLDRPYRIVRPTCAGRSVTVMLSMRHHATNGNDVILGTTEADDILGLRGNDVICSLSGADRVRGGPGNDHIVLGSGEDWGLGQDGNDTVDGENDADLVEGGNGNDLLIGGGGLRIDDYCDGGPGVDTIRWCEYIRRIP